ncbi:poly(A)-specific ribonuclease PARN-like [Spinacia oleracea]|uniref:Poly(A)-specific ribonuclease PARN-like n=1 Tax=Spinacia oleracea TaxID=3562 RepID=A0A9R0I518_SPIOL|nr:poly(A)-specific ribonuclease PARN-like [Spinacia oleracea]
MQKRLFCTQAAIQIENTIKNTSLSKKWIIKQVKKSNFSQVLDEIKPHISNSDFIAISLQKTGSYSSPWQRVLPFDTPEISYLKAKRSAERFQVLQFAVCPFTLRASKLTAYPYNFHLFPRDELKIGMPSYSFACQTSYLTAMARLGFDFNSCIYDGISYISRAQESSMKHLPGNTMLRAHASQSSPAVSVADSIYIQRIKTRVKTWIKACKDSKGLNEDPMVRALRKVIMGEHGSRPCLDLDVCSERQVQLVLEVMKEYSDDTVPLLIPAKRGGTQGLRIVLTSSEQDKILFQKELQDLEEEQSKNVRGFREVIDLISASGKPVIAHNSLDDFTFIHSKFLSTLPPTIDEFKHSLSSFFPYIIDMGHVTKEFNRSRNMNNIPAASSFLRSRFFAPIDMDIPIKGTPDEMSEGKINGQNVLQLSHLFAKLNTIINRGQHHVISEDKILALDNFANVFDPYSSPLPENSDDDDVRISSGSLRKLSCDNMVFIWGFRSGLSTGELKTLLSGSHEAFSAEFDVQLVDKSCAVAALQQPGLAGAFVKAMESGGGCHEGGLKELLSEGLRAADYGTYKLACNMSKWDSNLADSLDQVLMSADQFPVDNSHGRSPYEIWWDDDTVLNLDDL